MPSIPGMENINWLGFLSSTMYWVGIVLVGLIMAAAFFIIFHMLSFKYKVTIIPLYGGVEDKTFSIGKPKSNRVKYNKLKTSWKTLFPLFNKEEKEPFKPEHIYPGNRIYAFNLGDQWIPASLEITTLEKKILGKINPVPNYIKNWQSLARKKNAMEFAEHNWWEDNKQYIIMLGVVIFCLALCGATIYFTYQFTTGQFAGGVDAMNGLTNALKNFNPGGVGPG